MSRLFLVKKPVGWFVGGAKVPGGRAWGNLRKRVPSNIFDDVAAGAWLNSGEWVDNGDGTATITGSTTNRHWYKSINSLLTAGHTYRITFEVISVNPTGYNLVVGGQGSFGNTTGIVTRDLVPSFANSITGMRALTGTTMTIRYDTATLYDLG